MEISKLLEELKLVDIEAIDEDGNTALHLTVENKTFTQKEMIDSLQILLDRGINPDIENKHDETVLQLAVVYRIKDVVDFLISRKLNMDSVAIYFIKYEYKTFKCRLSTEELASNLHRIENESASYIEWLISKGFDFDHKVEKDQSPLHLAINYNLQHILPVLLKCTKNVHSNEGENKTLLRSFLGNCSTFRLNSDLKKWYSDRYAAKIVKILLERGVSTDAKYYDKSTPAQIAFENGADIKVMKLLLAHSTKINSKNYKGESLLQKVMQSYVFSDESEMDYHLEILHTIIAQGANVNGLNKRDEYGNTALGYAVTQRNFQAIGFLQENRAKFSVITKNGENLLHLLVNSSTAAKKKIDEDAEINLFNLLIRKGCQVNAKDENGQTPLYRAVFQDNLAFARKLVEHGAEVNVKTRDVMSPLQIAATIRYSLRMVEFLREHGADFSVTTENNENLLHLFVNRNVHMKIDNDVEMALFNLVINEGCSVNARDIKGNTPLHNAVMSDNVAMVQKLLEHGAEVNCKTRDGETPLLIAVIKKYDPYMVELLRENGATNNGETLIHHLLKSSEFMKTGEESRVNLFNLILNEGCPLNAKDETGTSLIHLAVSHANVSIVQWLIERGVDVNCRNDRKETPLHLVTTGSKAVDVAVILLEHGANVNAKDLQGQTALQKVAKEPRSDQSGDMVVALLEYGADVNTKDVKGIRALEYARARDKENYEKERRDWIRNYRGNHFVDEDDDEDRLTPENYYERVTEWASWPVILLTWHSTKLKVANLPWDRKIKRWLGNFEMLAGSDSHEEQYEDCLAEVEELKKTFIRNRVSLYDFLHMNPNSRCAYVKNEKLQKLVQPSSKLEEQFPEYFVLILANYREASTRKSLLLSAKEAWLELTEIALPDLCLECIFSFLSNSDLFDMIEKD